MKNVLVRLAALSLSLLGLAACSFVTSRTGAATVAAPLVARVDLKAIAKNFPNVDGSTTSLPLLRIIAYKSLDVQYTWGQEPQPGAPQSVSRYVYPTNWDKLSPSVKATLDKVQVNTTHNAFMNLLDGKADLILMANLPSEEETRAARSRGIDLDIDPIALDALVCLVNRQNAVDNLTTDQVKGILTGKVTDWSQVGGTNAKIEPYLRDPNSGSQELMEDLILKGTPMLDTPEMIIPTMVGEVNMVGYKPDAFGYSVYYYVTNLLIDSRVKMLGINGVQPTPATIANRTYPLAAEFYVLIRQNTPPDSPALILRNWLLTDEGQAAVKESGYVPIR